MKLTNVRIKDFRSFRGEHEFDFTDGVNYLVGPNNCGKSNLIRAIALALDPDAEFIPEIDHPARETTHGRRLKTSVTLTFKASNTSVERTLMARAKAYELAVRAAGGRMSARRPSTFAGDRELRMTVSFSGRGARRITFQAKNQGGRFLSQTDPAHQKLLGQFRRTVRFAVVRTGEDLESLLSGKFREILHLVLKDHLKDAMGAAEREREEYVAALQAGLLEPLRNRIQERVGGMFPEISVASLVPAVPTVSQTLSSVDVRLGDANSTTQLAEKGTGVRGAVFIAMVRYLAEQSARSLVLAIEEPESFLHPAGQEAIRDHLDELARPYNVSLVVTTHSPYVISRRPDALVRELRKDRDGWTATGDTATGDQERAALLGALYRDAGMASVLERALEVPEGRRGVVITEGPTDRDFLSTACAVAGVAGLVDNLHFIPAYGAKKLVVQAILAASATQLPVVVLVDYDEMGRWAGKKLVDDFRWQKAQVVSLRGWPGRCHRDDHDVEIEALIPDRLAMRVAEQAGGKEVSVDHETECRRGNDPVRMHYGFTAAWKEVAPSVVARLMKKDDAGDLVWLAEELNHQIDKVNDARAKAAAHS